ncbi:MAG TPA: hypothetical protein VIM61_14445 [Chthoniobacterales bacterium]
MPSAYALAAAVLAALWLAAAFSRAAVRRALVNGLRCLTRHGEVVRIPLTFALGYAAFQFLAVVTMDARLDAKLPIIIWDLPPPVSTLAGMSWLPAAEHTAAVFTVFTATFPLSAWFAFLLVINTGGLLGELARALRKRFGAVRGIPLLLLLFLGALAAVLKPAVYLLLPELAEFVPITIPMAINALSTGFELLLGIYFLTYLMLLTHVWLRGLSFERRKLRRLAMRRTGVVLRWSLVLLGLSVAVILLPLYVGLLVAPGEPFYERCVWFSTWIGRPVVTAVALLSCAVQASLVFRSEPLRNARRRGGRLFARHAADIVPFLGVAGLSFFVLEMALEFTLARLGAETLVGFAGRFLAAGIEAFLSGWLIAAWVCLYKGFSSDRKEVLF